MGCQGAPTQRSCKIRPGLPAIFGIQLHMLLCAKPPHAAVPGAIRVTGLACSKEVVVVVFVLFVFARRKYHRKNASTVDASGGYRSGDNWSDVMFY